MEFTAQYRLLYCHALHLIFSSSLPLQSTEKEMLLQLYMSLHQDLRLDKFAWSCSLGWGGQFSCNAVCLHWLQRLDRVCNYGADFYSAAAFHPARLCLSELEFSFMKNACLFLCYVSSTVQVKHESILSNLSFATLEEEQKFDKSNLQTMNMYFRGKMYDILGFLFIFIRLEMSELPPV